MYVPPGSLKNFYLGGGSMKKIVITIVFACAFLGCEKEEGPTQPLNDQTIRTSLLCTDTLGNVRTYFFTEEHFYMVFIMTNKTGKDRNYSWTGPASEIRIIRNDTIVSTQYSNIYWPQVINHGVLKADSSFVNRWLGPFNQFNSQLFLPPGNYEVDVHMLPSFDDVEIDRRGRLPITIDSPFVIVKKPNIYLYPNAACSLSVSLDFPNGGSVLQSLPTYANGWNVFAEPSGKINGQYDYLFYESKNPDLYQYDAGWIVARDTLSSFFTRTLLAAGFLQNEKNDFIDYWIPRLIDFPYYIIYPQQRNDIDKTIRLRISPSPDKQLRMFFVIRGSSSPNDALLSPNIPECERTGFVAAEWGVILK
jgi:hypothetical protein